MFENIFETVIKGSNTEFLNIPEEDYFLSYDSITYDAAEDITQNYFSMKGKDGEPKVIDISFDSNAHVVKIALEVHYERNHKLEPLNVPDMLNIRRK